MTLANYTTGQGAAMDRDTPQMRNAGVPLSAELDYLKTAVKSGAVGIQSDARDIDALALGGGACRWDNDSTPGNSLSFAIIAGRARFSQGIVAVNAQTITLATATVNYVEIDKTGTLLSNTIGFTAGNVELYLVTTGAATYSAGNVVSQRVLLQTSGKNSISGAMLTPAAQTKEIAAQLAASIAATTVFLIPSPNVAAVLAAARFVNSTAFATDNTNYWTWAIANLGPSGGGATAMLAATAANTTQTTGGSSLTAGQARSLTLHGTPANLNTAAGDVLQLTITKTGAPAALTLAAIGLDFTFQS
jgi:hypothetical protein